ncbi:MAG: 3-mercaptopyruvate sulfurtransferase [Pseudomonadota bacterium]|jgi:thiosulfate/3-mercaptopyruvate sulfurtransferase
MDALVSTDWLASALGAPDVRVVDATSVLASDGRSPAAEYEAQHIPGAVFMDLGEIVDTSSPLPMMLPSAEKFASRMQSLGLGDGSRIVIYDNSPYKSAARAWWMLSQVFGAHGVAVLDGGLAKWLAEGRPTESGKPSIRHRHFTVWKNDKVVRTKAQILANLDSGAEQLMDARGAARFTGAEGDPRPHVAPGHIPGSRNLPFGQLFHPDGTWKRGDALRAAFEAAGIDLSRPLVATCGSGLTAANLVFGAYLLGKTDVALYDGSWSDWGADPETPKATGPA